MWVGILSFFLVLFLLYTFLSFVVLYQSSDYYGGTLKTRSFKGYRTWSIMLWTLRKNIQLYMFIHVLFIYILMMIGEVTELWYYETFTHGSPIFFFFNFTNILLEYITLLKIIIDPCVFFPFSTSGSRLWNSSTRVWFLYGQIKNKAVLEETATIWFGAPSPIYISNSIGQLDALRILSQNIMTMSSGYSFLCILLSVWYEFNNEKEKENVYTTDSIFYNYYILICYLTFVKIFWFYF